MRDPLGPAHPVSARTKLWAAHGFAAALLLLWAAVSLAVPEYLIPPPWTVARRFADFFLDGRLAAHAATTLFHVGAALAAALLIGLAASLTPYLVPLLGFALDRRIVPFLNAFSGLGWAILAVLWFGVQQITVIFAVTAVLLPFVLIGLREGMAAADREAIEMATSFTRARRRHIARLILPALMPFTMAALRTGFGTAWKVVLVVELLGGNAGLGYILNVARQNYDSATLFAVIALIVVFVYCADRFVFAAMLRRAQRAYGGL